jgi:hypothetical protein
MLAYACDLTNEWPGDVYAEREWIEIELAAHLQYRIYDELWGE